MYKNVVGWCPICNQGWIRIVVDDDSNQLFCCCSECENEWNDPFNLNIKNSNKRFKYGGYHEANDYEVEDRGWSKCIISNDVN